MLGIEDFLDSQARVKELKGENAGFERMAAGFFRGLEAEKAESERQRLERATEKEREYHAQRELQAQIDIADAQRQSAIQNTQRTFGAIKLIAELKSALSDPDSYLSETKEKANRDVLFLSAAANNVIKILSSIPNVSSDTIAEAVELKARLDNLVKQLTEAGFQTSDVIRWYERIVACATDIESRLYKEVKNYFDKTRRCDDLDCLENERDAVHKWAMELAAENTMLEELLNHGEELGIIIQSGNEQNKQICDLLVVEINTTKYPIARIEKLSRTLGISIPTTLDIITNTNDLETTLYQPFQELHEKNINTPKRNKESTDVSAAEKVDNRSTIRKVITWVLFFLIFGVGGIFDVLSKLHIIG